MCRSDSTEALRKQLLLEQGIDPDATRYKSPKNLLRKDSKTAIAVRKSRESVDDPGAPVAISISTAPPTAGKSVDEILQKLRNNTNALSTLTPHDSYSISISQTSHSASHSRSPSSAALADEETDSTEELRKQLLREEEEERKAMEGTQTPTNDSESTQKAQLLAPDEPPPNLFW